MSDTQSRPDAVTTLQRIQEALSLLPIGISTYNDIKRLLAKDTTLAEALDKTKSNNDKVKAKEWLATHTD